MQQRTNGNLHRLNHHSRSVRRVARRRRRKETGRLPSAGLPVSMKEANRSSHAPPTTMPEPSILCVTVGRGRHRHLIAEHKHLAEQGCRLVELRLDVLVTPPNLKRLLAERPCPIIVTCRREKDGGRWAKSEEERQMLLRQAIVAGVEY